MGGRHGQGGLRRVGGLLVQFQGVFLNRAVGHDQYQEGQIPGQADYLDRTNLLLITVGGKDHGRAPRQVGQQVAGLGQHLLHLPVRPTEERLHLLPVGGVQGARAVDPIHEEPVGLLGWHPARRGVGLHQVPLLLEVGQLVADSGRGDVDLMRAGDPGRAHRQCRLDVLLDDGAQDGRLAVLQHGADAIGHPPDHRVPCHGSDVQS